MAKPRKISVWRVETRASHATDALKRSYTGAFQSGGVSAYLAAIMDDDRCRSFDPHSHPSPYTGETPEMVLKFSEDRHVFGVRSLTQLRDWFPSAKGRKAMEDECDLVARRYEVPAEDTVRGIAQTMFNPTRAEPVETRSVYTLKKED
jgi:hypothetical protein